MLENEKIKLRALEPQDAQTIYKWENDTEIWKMSNTIKPFSLNTIKEYINNDHLDIFQIKQQRFMINEKKYNKTIGMIDLFNFDIYNSRAEIGIMIAKKFRQKGYASNAIELITKYAFKILNIHQIYCNITTENTNSTKLFEKNKFVKSETKKEWIFNGEKFLDVKLYQKINPKHKK